jgi:hypothetical protein
LVALNSKRGKKKRVYEDNRLPEKLAYPERKVKEPVALTEWHIE